jgi:hypothetical protein
MRLTSILSHIAVQSAEDDVYLILELFRAAVLEHKVAELLAHGHALLPLDGIAVFLASVPGAGSNGGKSEVRVKGEEQDEALAYTASGAENTYETILLALASRMGRLGFVAGMPRVLSGLTNRTASWESWGPGKRSVRLPLCMWYGSLYCIRQVEEHRSMPSLLVTRNFDDFTVSSTRRARREADRGACK